MYIIGSYTIVLTALLAYSSKVHTSVRLLLFFSHFALVLEHAILDERYSDAIVLALGVIVVSVTFLFKVVFAKNESRGV